MRYYVIGPNQVKYGPADISTLNQWIREGRILPYTEIESEDGSSRVSAVRLPGLVFYGQAPGNVGGGAPPVQDYPTTASTPSPHTSGPHPPYRPTYAYSAPGASPASRRAEALLRNGNALLFLASAFCCLGAFSAPTNAGLLSAMPLFSLLTWVPAIYFIVQAKRLGAQSAGGAIVAAILLLFVLLYFAVVQSNLLTLINIARGFFSTVGGSFTV
jgi:hypothetical protein